MSVGGDHYAESLTEREKQQAGALQRRGLRVRSPLVDSPDFWEKLRRRLDGRRCETCDRSLYGHNSRAEVCGEACKKRRKRLREGAHTPERKRNQRDAIETKHWHKLIAKQIKRMKAERTWADLAAMDKGWCGADDNPQPRYAMAAPDERELRAARVAAMAAAIDAAAESTASRLRHSAPASPARRRLRAEGFDQMNHDPTRGTHDQHAISDTDDRPASR